MVNQRLALLILKKLGYEADVVFNGREVLETLNTKEYDIILMDVQMPEMDGLEATTALRKMTLAWQQVIVAVTANAMQGDREKCIEAGMDDYISKPIKLENIIAILKKWGTNAANAQKSS